MLQRNAHPLTKTGHFLVYKTVRRPFYYYILQASQNVNIPVILMDDRQTFVAHRT